VEGAEAYPELGVLNGLAGCAEELEQCNRSRVVSFGDEVLELGKLLLLLLLDLLLLLRIIGGFGS
jgi:hypothetical protein